MIREYITRIPAPARWLILIAAALILVFIFWFYSTRIINAVGHYYFRKEMDAAQAQVRKELDEAAAQKKELERTLIQLDESKKQLAAADAARIEAERVLNDKTKTANEKVAAFRATLNDAPIHTDTGGVTTSDLCERAKATGASTDTLLALCGR